MRGTIGSWNRHHAQIKWVSLIAIICCRWLFSSEDIEALCFCWLSNSRGEVFAIYFLLLYLFLSNSVSIFCHRPVFVSTLLPSQYSSTLQSTSVINPIGDHNLPCIPNTLLPSTPQLCSYQAACCMGHPWRFFRQHMRIFGSSVRWV